MKRRFAFCLLAVILVPMVLATGCSSSPAHDMEMAPVSLLPTRMQNAPVRVREAYQFAVANPDALRNVPCYCGCGAAGHKSNYDCFVKPGNAGTFDEHALGCSLCVDIAQDVMRMTGEGRSPPDIRAAILGVYSRYGPSNQ